MNRMKWGAGLAAGAVLGTALMVPAGAKDWTERVKFKRNRSSAVIEGAVVRGDRDRYLVEARAGQRMTVHIRSLENNAVFWIQNAGNRRSLPGAGETADATRWSGRLPSSGDYIITVGGTRGNAGYTLTVSVR